MAARSEYNREYRRRNREAILAREHAYHLSVERQIYLKAYNQRPDIILKTRKRMAEHAQTPKGRMRIRKYVRKYGPVYTQNIRNSLIDRMGGACVKCGYTDKRALHFDHIHGNGCKHRLIQRSTLSRCNYWNDWLNSGGNISNVEFPIQLLCANCNMIKRFENKEWSVKRKPDIDII